jgi:hypothetical protein
MSEELVKEYGDQAFSHIQIEMGDRWNLLTDAQKSSTERSMKRLVALDIKKRAGEDVDEDLAFVKSTVNEIKLAAEIAVSDIFWTAFWNGVDKALAALGTFLVSAGKSALGLPGLDLGGFLNAGE